MRASYNREKAILQMRVAQPLMGDAAALAAALNMALKNKRLLNSVAEIRLINSEVDTNSFGRAAMLPASTPPERIARSEIGQPNSRIPSGATEPRAPLERWKDGRSTRGRKHLLSARAMSY